MYRIRISCGFHHVDDAQLVALKNETHADNKNLTHKTGAIVDHKRKNSFLSTCRQANSPLQYIGTLHTFRQFLYSEIDVQQLDRPSNRSHAHCTSSARNRIASIRRIRLKLYRRRRRWEMLANNVTEGRAAEKKN